MRHILEEQRTEREEEVKALLERQVLALEEATERLRTSHQQEIKDLMDKHQQEVGFKNYTNFKGHQFYKFIMVYIFTNLNVKVKCKYLY